MAYLGLSSEGRAIVDMVNGRYDRDCALLCRGEGRLTYFGHAVGASGLGIVCELYNQLLDRTDNRWLAKVNFGRTHNLVGQPANRIAAVSSLGKLN